MDDASEVLASRLKEAVKQAGGNAVVAKRSDVPLSTLNTYLSGQTEPKATILKRIADATGKSVDWFLGAETAGESLGSHTPEDIVMIPVLDVRVAAGSGGWNDRANETEAVPFQRSFFRSRGIDPEYVHGIRPDGDSMEPTISRNALCLVNTARKEIGGDGMWVFVLDEQARVKRVQRNFDGSVSLLSDNSRLYPPERLERDELHNLNVVGHLFWIERDVG